ncbi:mannonate dehydratase [Candidatus Latescibacterota bacterium]
MSIFGNMKEPPEESNCVPSNINRRNFGKLVLAGAMGGKALLSSSVSEAREYVSGQKPNPSNIRLGLLTPANPNEDELTWIKQLGVKDVCVWTGWRPTPRTKEKPHSVPFGRGETYENFLRIRKTYENAGIKVVLIGNSSVHNMEEVTLNLPGRDEKIEEYLTYLRNLGRAGVHQTTYAHMANGIWRTEFEKTRGGARALSLDLKLADEGKASFGSFMDFIPKDLTTPTHGRVYSEDEIWENYTYFIKKVVPVAEEENIRIGIHPDDPPVPVLGGIPRCIFGNFEGYKRAMEIADSPNVGLCLCVGTWLSGGDLMGKDIIETIHYFGKLNKIFKIHLRNVDQPVPHFMETFVDNGYMDMYKVMKALVEVNNNTFVVDGHIPGMVGGRRMTSAFHMGYMRALLERANEEVQS